MPRLYMYMTVLPCGCVGVVDAVTWQIRSGKCTRRWLHAERTMLLAHAATVTERMCGTCDVLLLACQSAEFCFNFMHWLTILTVEQVHVRTRSVPSLPSPAGAVSLESFSSLFQRSQCTQCMQHFRTWKKMKPRCDRQEYYFRLSIFRRIPFWKHLTGKW